MTSEHTPEEVREEPEPLELVEFLESIPPNQLHNTINLSQHEYRQKYGQYVNEMLTPEIQLHCSNDACNGIRFFRCVTKESPLLNEQNHKFFYLTYRCSNCQETEKTFSLAVKLGSEDSDSGECYKFGELPPFGPPTPARLIKLIGPDRESFLKGRRCENQGLGIGAFIYWLVSRICGDNQVPATCQVYDIARFVDISAS